MNRGARREWLQQAQQHLEERIGAEDRERIRSEAADNLEELQAEIERLNDALRVDIDPDKPARHPRTRDHRRAQWLAVLVRCGAPRARCVQGVGPPGRPRPLSQTRSHAGWPAAPWPSPTGNSRARSGRSRRCTAAGWRGIRRIFAGGGEPPSSGISWRRFRRGRAGAMTVAGERCTTKQGSFRMRFRVGSTILALCVSAALAASAAVASENPTCTA